MTNSPPHLEPQNALLIHAHSREEGRQGSAEGRMEELSHLVSGAGLLCKAKHIFNVARIHPATYLGKGQVEGIKDEVENLEVEVVVFNHTLSPVQQRNLEKILGAKVVDRTGLILEIFSARARTREGRLQVTLASLLYQQSRLVRSWSHLERQRGGVGLRGGPGETQIEVDRRMLRDKIHRLKKQLTQVERTRGLQREARRDVPYFTVSLVGYTNAGKSTLFNRLTHASVFEADQLFATLDPTMRGVTLPSGVRVIMSDTVGFIRDLPHQLVAAFRATLEEVLEADLLLHVVDLSDGEYQEQVKAVFKVLHELGADDKPMLTLYNKFDLLEASSLPLAERLATKPDSLVVSARTGAGLEALIQRLEQTATQHSQSYRLELPATDGALLARLCREGHILERRDFEDRVLITVSLSPTVAGRLKETLQPYLVPLSTTIPEEIMAV